MRKPAIKPGPGIIGALELSIEALNYLLRMANHQGWGLKLKIVHDMSGGSVIELEEIICPD